MNDVKIYIDTNILSRISDLNISEESAECLAALGNRKHVRLVTSSKALQELRRTPNRTRNAVLRFLYSFVQKIEAKTLEYSGVVGGAPAGATPVGGGWTDPTYWKLKQIFDTNDAQHIAHATKERCDFFITLDRKTILNRVFHSQNDIKTVTEGMKIVSPCDALNGLDGNDNSTGSNS